MNLWSITPEPVDGPVGTALLREYYTDIVHRYYQTHHGRDAAPAEIDQALAEEPSGHLAPPGGEFLVARRDGMVAGCAGVHLLAPGTAELTRVFIRPPARRHGGGTRLISAAERAARRTLRAGLLRLDTRHDLVEARALYARMGYAEIPAYNDSPYAGHWFEKSLTP
ncbi:GNAT family N-acetyltransferase [Streptomyces silvisoli]|uniref:GNAT family N-acetyltransferase n=1 Tax=Streptomyces silvisoli TaxID=3034235 RepID=A0ABT5ZW40_9ACTN|nr:GNAT family N-acetyltransferase [Streptomyces silvisoli]MDF3294048.1 GNAT family N-acetyltransferase [Streptomyces silvisoli]